MDVTATHYAHLLLQLKRAPHMRQRPGLIVKARNRAILIIVYCAWEMVSNNGRCQLIPNQYLLTAFQRRPLFLLISCQSRPLSSTEAACEERIASTELLVAKV